MKDYSKLFRWMLLVTSAVTLIFLVAAAWYENVGAEWRGVQRDYRKILAEQATDDRGKEILANFNVELRQISVPALDAVDRCVTCHVGIDDPRMAGKPQPFASHPGNILDYHPADRFGCTVCHQGQGRATTFRDAKGEDAFWDYPLLTADLTQSSCLSCHDVTQLPPEQVPLLLEGKRLYEKKSCGSCHKLDGRGGILGPQLDNEGMKTRHQLVLTNLRPPHTTWRWHLAHFRDPGGIVAASQMPNPTVTEREALALTVYMLAQRERDVPESYLAPDKIEEKFHALNPAALTGEEAYRRYCFACHGEGTYGTWNPIFRRFIPAIRGPSLVATAERKYLESQIAQGRPGTQMPGWEKKAGGFRPEEISALLDYLGVSGSRAAALQPTSARALSGGDATHGGRLFLQNCAGCHGIDGRGALAPEIGNSAFLQAASDAFIATTIRNGRTNTAMPAFQRPGAAGLTDAEIADLIAFLRSLVPPAARATTAQTNKNGVSPASGGSQ